MAARKVERTVICKFMPQTTTRKKKISSLDNVNANHASLGVRHAARKQLSFFAQAIALSTVVVD